MKENVIDVLMFLFDNYLTLEATPTDELTLAFELEEAGFQVKDIHRAFDWLGELAEMQPANLISPTPNTYRILTREEQLKLDANCLGFLLQLQQMGLVDTILREMILERAMAIPVKQLSLQQFKRIIGLVMLQCRRDEETFLWIEDLIDEKPDLIMH